MERNFVLKDGRSFAEAAAIWTWLFTHLKNIVCFPDLSSEVPGSHEGRAADRGRVE
jgi:hypothetical protein